MDLAQIMESVRGKKILFLGQTRTMSEEDIELLLDQVGAQKATDETDEPIALIVQGRLINPYEESYCDEKEKAGTPVISLEALEKYYASHIDPDALLGSLKLFANRERIINLLHTMQSVMIFSVRFLSSMIGKIKGLLRAMRIVMSLERLLLASIPILNVTIISNIHPLVPFW